MDDQGRPFSGLEVETIHFTLKAGSGDSVEIRSRRETLTRRIAKDLSASESGPYRVHFRRRERIWVFDLAPDSCSAVALDTLRLQACPAVEGDRKRGLLFDGIYLKDSGANVAALQFGREDRLWIARGLPPDKELLVAAVFAHFLSRGGQPLENHRLSPKWLDQP
jgi:hypothetical protein